MLEKNKSFTNLYSRFNNKEYRLNFNDEYGQMVSEIKQGRFDLDISDYVGVYRNVINADLCEEVSSKIKIEKNKSEFVSPMTNLLRVGKYVNVYGVDSDFKKDIDDIVRQASERVKSEYLNNIRPFFYSYGEKLDVCEPHILDYSENDFFRLHHDHYAESLNFSRLLTVCVYLNEDYDGGDLDFPSIGKRFSFETGDIIAFPSNWMFYHGVTPITRGNRYTIVFWIGVQHDQL
jgi:hypothetical protein